MDIRNALISLDCEDSDEDDDDYVPSGGDDSEDDIEGEAEVEESQGTEKKISRKEKKLKLEKNTKSRKRKGGISLSDDEEQKEAEEEQSEDPPPQAEAETEKPEEKKRADSLWADFLTDVAPPPKKSCSSSSPLASTRLPASSPSLSPPKPKPVPQKVTITKVFEFAGESVVVKEEVDSNSKAAMQFSEDQRKPTLSPQQQQPSSNSSSVSTSAKKPNGLNAVLGKVLGKKNKLSTLEKSQLDWKSFKKDEGVEEVLDQYKRSKDGYLERQAFLERADLRQFEREKEMRAANRVHRV